MLTTNKTLLLRGLRRGDFGALLALQDWYLEFGPEKAAKEIDEYLRIALYHVQHPGCGKRMGQAESMRRWFRDLAKKINRRERCWRFPNYDRNSPFWTWCMALARASLKYYKEQEPTPETADDDRPAC